MRYFVSDRPNPSAWKETKKTDERAVIDDYINSDIRIHDADNCGSEDFYFAFSTGRHFKVTYSWWFFDHDDYEGISDEVDVVEIDGDKAEGICADRDWLALNQYGGKTIDKMVKSLRNETAITGGKSDD